MQAAYFLVTGENCFELVNNCIKEEYEPEYEKRLVGGMVYCRDEFVFLNGENVMVTIIIEKVNNRNNQCAVEIVVGGARAVLFSITTGSEKHRVRKLYNRLLDFCDGLGYEISNLEEQ